MSNRPAQDGHQPFLVVLSSPSGAGKTSICRGVTKQDRRVAYSVSATTRPRRKGEVNGRSYSFLTEKRFKRLVARNGLLEHALVYGYYYGTPKAPVLRHFRAGQDVIADLDVQGMRSAKAALPGTVAVFVTAPCRTEIGRRLKRRGTDSEQTMARRQAEMEAEFAAIPDFDYLVVNDRLNDAVARVLAIIRAERQRTARHPAFARRGMSRQAKEYR